MAGRSGSPLAPIGKRQGPIPLTHKPLTEANSFLSKRASRACTSAHQTDSASCSTHPGWGKETPWDRSNVARTVPSAPASTAFELDVPMSRPRRSSSTSGLLRAARATVTQLELEYLALAALASPLEPLQQQIDRCAGHDPHRLCQGRKRWVGQLCPWRVVDRDKRDVQRDP